MVQALLLTTLLLGLASQNSGQTLSILRVRVVLLDAGQRPTPVAGHALLVSDNPASAPPRRIVCGRDGRADVRLRPGSYTVESERPVAFNGKVYQWTQTLEIAAGRDATLELTSDNAEVGAAGSAAAAGDASPEHDPSLLVGRWEDSVVALWTPTSRASGFLVDARGLVLTSQHAIGNAKSVEVQITPTIKVGARIVAADPGRDVAVLWIDPTVTASLQPVPLACTQAVKPPVRDRQEIFTIGAPIRGQKQLTSGRIVLESSRILADVALEPGSTGGPVFTADGTLLGITGVLDETIEHERGDVRIVQVAAACDLLRVGEKGMRLATAPSGTHLPVEPTRRVPTEALQDAAQRRGSSVSPYQMSSSDFDIAFITPVLIYAAEHRPEQAGGGGGNAGLSEAANDRIRLLTDFGNWSDYVAESPPVLLVRATPRLVEGFWTMVARGAARTQGVSLPPIKRFKPGFWQMRAFCGATEVTPIHPFEVERRLPNGEAIREGLFVFDPDALGPPCGTVKLVLYSEKEPAKGETRIVDPKLLQQVWQDFAPYRAAIAQQ
jgi:hypothetical protein